MFASFLEEKSHMGPHTYERYFNNCFVFHSLVWVSVCFVFQKDLLYQQILDSVCTLSYWQNRVKASSVRAFQSGISHKLTSTKLKLISAVFCRDSMQGSDVLLIHTVDWDLQRQGEAGMGAAGSDTQCRGESCTRGPSGLSTASVLSALWRECEGLELCDF